MVAFTPDGCNALIPRCFLFDEIGRAEGWFDWLKHAIDKRVGRFVVTDSSATLLRGGARESGLGRWDELLLEGLTFHEYVSLLAVPGEALEAALQRLPDPWGRYLARGGFPEHALSEDVQKVRQRLRSDIVDKALGRDLMSFGFDLPRLVDLFVYLAENCGTIVDPVKLARSLDSSTGRPDRRSMEKYLDVLKETRLVCLVSLFGHKASKRLSGKQRPKAYMVDHGLVSAFSSLPSPTDDPSTRAKIFETVVYRHLRQVAERDADITYFRSDKGDIEADFVVSTRQGLVTVEVTASAEPPLEKIERVAQAQRQTRSARALLVHGGFETREKDGVTLVPASRFALDPERWLEAAP